MNKVKGYRTMINMTQEEMAGAIGIATTTYRQKESGQTQFTLNEIKLVVNVFNDKGLNLTINDLV